MIMDGRQLQLAVGAWALQCFGEAHVTDHHVRAMRLLEEAAELVQATGLREDTAQAVLRYVYSRPVGELRNEFAGTMMTLCVLANSYGIDLGAETTKLLEICWERTEAIRQKDLRKPDFDVEPVPVRIPTSRQEAEAMHLVATRYLEDLKQGA